MCKNLFKTDLNICHNRLSMPSNDIKYDFLTEIEKAILDTKEGKKDIHILCLHSYEKLETSFEAKQLGPTQ